jgi:CheY-like chemotaxis protein
VFERFRRKPAHVPPPTIAAAEAQARPVSPLTRTSSLFPLYFSQSAAALIDDDLAMINSLEALLPTTRALTFHTQPATFESVLQQSAQRLHQEQQALFACVEAQADNRLPAAPQPLVLLLRHFATPLRFEITAVAVADYQMPLVDGVELLDRHRAAGLRRILLTGVADNVVAIDAFNRRCIDGYLPKQAAELTQALLTMMDGALRESCKQRGEILGRAFTGRQAETMAYPESVEGIRVALDAVGAVEYAALGSPWGLLALTKDRRTMWLQIDDDESLADQAEKLLAIDPAQCDFDCAEAAARMQKRQQATNVNLVGELTWSRVQRSPLQRLAGSRPLYLSTYELTLMPGDLAPLHHASWLQASRGRIGA